MLLYDITTDAQKLPPLCCLALLPFSQCLSPVFNNAGGLCRGRASCSSSSFTDAFLTQLRRVVLFQTHILNCSRWKWGENVGYFLHRRHQRLANVSRDCFNPPPGAVDRLLIEKVNTARASS